MQGLTIHDGVLPVILSLARVEFKEDEMISRDKELLNLTIEVEQLVTP